MANNFEFYDLKPETKTVKDDILTSLTDFPKHLSPKYFYDKNGSKLFTEICKLDEYYPTRTEISILKNNIKDIVSIMGRKPMIIEFGSGASEKIKLILSALDTHSSYMAIDISKDFLIESSKKIALQYSDINVYALCTDYSKSINLPEFCKLRQNKVFYFSGSSFGNFNEEQQNRFLANTRSQLNTGEAFLIGLDLIKDKSVLNAAYNDNKNVTAKFNLNILNNINQLGNGNFDSSKFEHVAFYNDEMNRIEMHLKSLENQYVTVFDKAFFIAENEFIHTENSYKFSKQHVEKLFLDHKFKLEKMWTDNLNYFGLFYFRAI